MKNKGGKQVPNCVPEEMSIEDAMKVDGYIPESYEEGEDYANHAKEITPVRKQTKNQWIQRKEHLKTELLLMMLKNGQFKMKQ